MENDFQSVLLSMVLKIKSKPGLYIGNKSITKLRSFLDGFSVGYSYPNVMNLFPGFQDYIELKYSCKLTISWNDILLFFSNNKEDVAFDLFFEELELFLKENNLEVPDIT